MVTGNPFIEKFGEFWEKETLLSFRRLKRLNKSPIDLVVLRRLYEYEKEKWIAEQQRLKELEAQQQLVEQE